MTTKLINVIDVEATCWEGDRLEGEVADIIEIGISVLDALKGERLESRSILVRPERSTVGAFCTSLTGLTQAQVDGGSSFAEACSILAADFDAAARPWTSWGSWDMKMFGAQCAETSVPYPFGASYVNASAVYMEVFGVRGRRPSMAEAMRTLGIEPVGRAHSAVDDSWNTAAVVRCLVDRWKWPDLGN